MKKNKNLFKILKIIFIVSLLTTSCYFIWNGVTTVQAERQTINENLVLGQHYISQRNADKAEMYFDEVLNIDKGNKEAQVGLEMVYAAQNKNTEALGKAKELLKQDSKDVLANNIVGLVNLNEGNFKDAKEQFEKLQQIDSKNKGKYVQLISDISKFENVNDTGKEEISKIIDDKFKDLAQNHFDEYVKKLGDNGITLKTVAEAEDKIDSGDASSAITKIKDLGDRVNSSPEVLRSLGKAYLIQQDHKNAEKTIEQSRSFRKNEESDVLLLENYISQVSDKNSQDNEKIKKSILDIAKRNKENIYVYQELAKYYFVSGDANAADNTINEMLEIGNKYYNDDSSITPLIQSLKFSKDAGNISNSLFRKLNKYLPENWIKEAKNDGWMKYMVSYINFQQESLKIMMVDTKSYPNVDVYFRVNGIKDGINLDKSKFNLADSGCEIKDFEFNTGSSSDSNIVVLMDKSGSMEGQKLDKAKEAAVNFVNKIKDNEHVMFGVFSDATEFKTDFCDSDAKDNIIGKVNSTQIGGGTNIYGSLEESLNKLEDRSGAKAIVLLTDGEDDNESLVPSVIEKAQQDGVPVFSIGLGSSPERLQQISLETGGQFLYANDAEQLERIYDTIRDQLNKTYKISYTVSDKDEENRQVRLSMNKENIWGYKAYNLNKSADKKIYELPSDAVTPREVFKQEDSKLKATIDVRTNEASNLGKVKNIYINERKLDTTITEDDGKVSFNIPWYLLPGTYSVYLEGDNGEIYTATDSITIKEYKSYETIKFGKFDITGDILKDKEGTFKSNGDLSLNENIKLSGKFEGNPKSNSLKGTGTILTSVNGNEVPIFKGNITVDGKSNKIQLDSQYEVEYEGFRMKLRNIQLTNGGILADGDVVARFGEKSGRQYKADYLKISSDGIKIQLSDFNYINSNINIKKTELSYENGEWKGKGAISIDKFTNIDGSQSDKVDYDGDFNIVLDNTTPDFRIKEIVFGGSEGTNIQLSSMGMNFTSSGTAILNPATDSHKLAISGKVESKTTIGGKNLTGNISLVKITDTNFGLSGDLNNEFLALKLYGNYNKDSEFYGAAEFNINNELLGNITGYGNIIMNKDSISGVFSDKNGQTYIISNDAISLLDSNQNITKTVSYDGQDLTKHNSESSAAVKNNQKITITDLSYSDGTLNLKWKVENSDNKTQINVYLCDELKGNKILIGDGISLSGNEQGTSMKFSNLRPGKYYVLIGFKGEDLYRYSFSDKQIEVSNSALPGILAIKKAYLIRDKLQIDLGNISNYPNLQGIKLYELDANGNIDVSKIRMYSIVTSISTEYESKNSKFRLAAYNKSGEEGPLSEVIDISKLAKETELFEVKWDPIEKFINKSSIDCNLNPMNNSKASILLNGKFILRDISKNGKYPVKLDEGYNEVFIQANNNSNSDEITKLYNVNTRAPIIQFDQNYEDMLSSENNIIISGKTEPNVELKVNDTVVSLDESGNFTQSIKLSYGSNPISVVVKNKYGNEAQYNFDIQHYGNLVLFISAGFVLLYTITILIFVACFKHKKKKLNALKSA